MSAELRGALLFVLCLAAASPGTAQAFDPERLEGRWCLLGVAAVEGERARAIQREWTFLSGGVLRIQSETSADVRMSVGYRLEGRRLSLPELDQVLMLEQITRERMTALDEAGRLRYRFARRACERSDGDTRGGERRREDRPGR